MSRIMRSYSKLWSFEKKMYTLFDKPLWVPVSGREVGYFTVIIAAVYVLSRLVPLFRLLPPVIRYAAIPFLITQFLMKKKLDGKNPAAFFRDWVIFIFRKHDCIERFKRVDYPNNRKAIRFNSHRSFRG